MTQDIDFQHEMKLWISLKKLRVLDKNYNEYHAYNTDLKARIFATIDKIWSNPFE